MITLNENMTERTKKLYDHLIQKAQGNRSPEWLSPAMFPKMEDINKDDYKLDGEVVNQTVLVRRAIAIDIMLKTMTDKYVSAKTGTGEIEEGDLLLGVLPMGSNGLGKVFPECLTEEELRAGSLTNRNFGSLFGHNTINYENLLSGGLRKIIDICDKKFAEAEEHHDMVAPKSDKQLDDLIDKGELKSKYSKRTYNEFYKGVKIACKAVINYAHNFAAIAEKKASLCNDEARKAELLEMARIATKVPEYPAETFHEAMQSITFFHIALHASMNFISLGRLDQVLQPYLEKETNIKKAQEIFECFLIKLAGRLNLSSDYLLEQDHVDYATVLGTHPYYIDQKAGVNNFLQNIIIGGVTPNGDDATNDATYLILQSFSNVNLSTPGIYVRIHKGTPDHLLKAISNCIHRTGNNPAVLNDEVMIPAIYKALMQDDMEALTSSHPTPEMEAKKSKMQKLANDYCIDGCWEPILNGCSDWTFTMPNLMTALEAAMNGGASLSPDEELFRGSKISIRTEIPHTFDELIQCFKKHLQFITDQSVMSMFVYYGIDEYAAPSPLLSAFMTGCMERGRDKAWAGADYNLGGVIYGGVPNVVNTMAALQKWVYEEKKYTIEEVCSAFRYNFTYNDATRKNVESLYHSIQVDFSTNSPKFGDNNEIADKLTRLICDLCYEAVMKSAEFGKRVFQAPVPKEEWKNVIALRNLAGYFGRSLSKKYENFQMKFTVGMGTFEQYNWQGRGIAASADRRSGEPIAPNFTPTPGTTHTGIAGMFESFSKLGLNRFAGGVITDLCLESNVASPDTIYKILCLSIEKKVPMYTISIGSEELYREIYETVIAASKMSNKEEAKKLLQPYAGVNVRIGGWQTPFITLPLSHMENYIYRPCKLC